MDGVISRLLRQVSGPGPVVDRNPQRADLPLFPEPVHLFLDCGGERGHLPEPVELEDVHEIDAKARRAASAARRRAPGKKPSTGPAETTYRPRSRARASRRAGVSDFIRGDQKTYCTRSSASRHPASSRPKEPERPRRKIRRPRRGTSLWVNSSTPGLYPGARTGRRAQMTMSSSSAVRLRSHRRGRKPGGPAGRTDSRPSDRMHCSFRRLRPSSPPPSRRRGRPFPRPAQPPPCRCARNR